MAEGVSVGDEKMRYLRCVDEEKRQDQGGRAQMAVRIVRQLQGRQERRVVEAAQTLRVVTPGEALPSRAQSQREDVLRPHPRLLEALADHPRVRRDPPRRLHGRHLALEEVRGPHRVHPTRTSSGVVWRGPRTPRTGDAPWRAWRLPTCSSATGRGDREGAARPLAVFSQVVLSRMCIGN